jgi:predicted Na+-dependent transporter
MADVITLLAVICVAGVGTGLGCSTTTDDFREALKNPKAVLTGFGSQYVFMPLIALAFTRLLGLNELESVGCILMGCSPGGSSSNLFTYWSHGNVALSITMSFCSTSAALGMLPLLIYLLIDLVLDAPGTKIAWSSIFSTLALILLPTVIGLYIRHTNTEKKYRASSSGGGWKNP